MLERIIQERGYGVKAMSDGRPAIFILVMETTAAENAPIEKMQNIAVLGNLDQKQLVDDLIGYESFFPINADMDRVLRALGRERQITIPAPDSAALGVSPSPQMGNEPAQSAAAQEALHPAQEPPPAALKAPPPPQMGNELAQSAAAQETLHPAKEPPPAALKTSPPPQMGNELAQSAAVQEAPSPAQEPPPAAPKASPPPQMGNELAQSAAVQEAPSPAQEPPLATLKISPPPQMGNELAQSAAVQEAPSPAQEDRPAALETLPSAFDVSPVVPEEPSPLPNVGAETNVRAVVMEQAQKFALQVERWSRPHWCIEALFFVCQMMFTVAVFVSILNPGGLNSLLRQDERYLPLVV